MVNVQFYTLKLVRKWTKRGLCSILSESLHWKSSTIKRSEMEYKVGIALQWLNHYKGNNMESSQKPNKKWSCCVWCMLKVKTFKAKAISLMRKASKWPLSGSACVSAGLWRAGGGMLIHFASHCIGHRFRCLDWQGPTGLTLCGRCREGTYVLITKVYALDEGTLKAQIPKCRLFYWSF